MKKITVKSIDYTTFADTASFPSSFSLTVLNPCLTATINSKPVANIEMYVFDASAAYSPFTEFTYFVGESATLCGSLSYTASIVPGAG